LEFTSLMEIALSENHFYGAHRKSKKLNQFIELTKTLLERFN
jgi:hypothetical protein